jgi:hypothetical protein
MTIIEYQHSIHIVIIINNFVEALPDLLVDMLDAYNSKLTEKVFWISSLYEPMIENV